MKKILTLLLVLNFVGCVPVFDGTWVDSCKYHNAPFSYEPLYCGPSKLLNTSQCCTWVTYEYYSECFTSWCLNEYLCEWHVSQQKCYPI